MCLAIRIINSGSYLFVARPTKTVGPPVSFITEINGVSLTKRILLVRQATGHPNKLKQFPPWMVRFSADKVWPDGPRNMCGPVSKALNTR